MKKFSGDIFEEVCFRFLQERYKNGCWNIVNRGGAKTLFGFIFENIKDINTWDIFRNICFNKKQLQTFIMFFDTLSILETNKIKIDELSQFVNIPEYGYESCWNYLQRLQILYNLYLQQSHHQLFHNTRKLKKNEIITVDSGRVGVIWQFSKIFLKEWKLRISECIIDFEKFDRYLNRWKNIEKVIRGAPDCIIFQNDKIIIYEFKFGEHPYALTHSQKTNKKMNIEYKILNAKYNMPEKIKINEFFISV